VTARRYSFPNLNPIEWAYWRLHEYRLANAGRKPEVFNMTAAQWHYVRWAVAMSTPLMLSADLNGGPDRLFGVEIQIVEPVGESEGANGGTRRDDADSR
jgi:hypothetical protein